MVAKYKITHSLLKIKPTILGQSNPQNFGKHILLGGNQKLSPCTLLWRNDVAEAETRRPPTTATTKAYDDNSSKKLSRQRSLLTPPRRNRRLRKSQPTPRQPEINEQSNDDSQQLPARVIHSRDNRRKTFSSRIETNEKRPNRTL